MYNIYVIRYKHDGGGGGGGGGGGIISAVDFVRLKRLVVNAFESTKVSNSVRQFYPKLESKLEQTSFCCGKCILFVYFCCCLHMTLQQESAKENTTQSM